MEGQQPLDDAGAQRIFLLLAILGKTSSKHVDRSLQILKDFDAEALPSEARVALLELREHLNEIADDNKTAHAILHRKFAQMF